VIGRWEGILFDLDGTLADTVPLILACFRHTMTVHRGAPLPDELWLRHVGRPLRDSMRDIAETAEEAAAMGHTYLEYQREAHDRMVRPFPGVGGVVAAIAGSHIPMAVVTSKTREMALRTLAVCGFEGAFPVVITADEVARGKPDPEPVLLALRDLAVQPGPRVLFVGDSPHDVAAGRAAGVQTAAVTWGAADEGSLNAEAPDHLVRHMEGLLRIRP
jgi:pyrophosphatase PpaX